jgi:hypothetical protein
MGQSNTGLATSASWGQPLQVGHNMSDTKIKLLVTQEKFGQVFSIDDWFNFDSLSQKEAYEKMLMFVVDENEKPVTIDEARAMFKKIPGNEWVDYLTAFMKAVNQAFVNPTNGGS